MKHKRSKAEQAIQDKKDATLLEMTKYILENRLTYSQVWDYAKENNKEDWLDVLWSRQRRQVIKTITKKFTYEAAKERNLKFYQWCKENGFSVNEGLSQVSNMPEFSDILMSPGSINRLYDMERAEASKKAKEGKPRNRKPMPVRCTDNGMEFPSINKAAAYFGIKRTHDVSDCCYGVIGNVRGYHFEFIEGEEK